GNASDLFFCEVGGIAPPTPVGTGQKVEQLTPAGRGGLVEMVKTGGGAQGGEGGSEGPTGGRERAGRGGWVVGGRRPAAGAAAAAGQDPQQPPAQGRGADQNAGRRGASPAKAPQPTVQEINQLFEGMVISRGQQALELSDSQMPSFYQKVNDLLKARKAHQVA